MSTDIYSLIAEEIAKFKHEVPNSNTLFFIDLSQEQSDDEEYDEFYIFIKTLPNDKISVRIYTFNAQNYPVPSGKDTLEAKYLSRYLKDIYRK